MMPTLLQSVGVDIPADVQGKSFLGLITPGNDAAESEWRDRPAFAEADYGHLAYGWSTLQSFRTGKYLFIQAPRRELYDAAADPKAEHNLAPASPAVAETLAGRVEAFREKTTTKREAPTVIVDPSTQEKLRRRSDTSRRTARFQSQTRRPRALIPKTRSRRPTAFAA